MGADEVVTGEERLDEVFVPGVSGWRMDDVVE